MSSQEAQSGVVRLEQIRKEQLKRTWNVYYYCVSHGEEPQLVCEESNEGYKAINRELGAAVLGLISDWSWVKRRVESVRVVESGYTERLLSLDLEVPYYPELGYSAAKTPQGKPPRQVALPLTFLRKGPLINFSLHDSGGNSLPSLGFYENGQLTYHALAFLAERLELSKKMDSLRKKLKEASENCFKEGGTQSKHWDFQRIDFRSLINQAISKIIYSKDYDEKAISETVVERAQETHRRDLFDSLSAFAAALAAGESINSDNCKYLPHEKCLRIPLSYWALGANFTNSRDLYRQKRDKKINSESTPMVLDSSLHVHLLALGLLEAILNTYNAAQLERQEKEAQLKGLELFCSLLSVVSASYLSAAVVDTESLWCLDGLERGEESRRAIVKIKCNVEINDREFTKEDYSFWANPGKHLARMFRSHINVLIRTTSRSAKSTHLEFTFPPGVRVSEVTAYTPPDPDNALALFKKERPFVEQFEFPLYSGNQSASPERACQTHSSESYRSSLGRIHIQLKNKKYPLEVLNFKLIPQRVAQPYLAVLIAFFSLLISGIVLYRQDIGLESGEIGWYSFAEFLASVTLLTALYGALYIIGNQHVVLQRAFRLTQSITGAAAFTSIVACCLPLAYMWSNEPVAHSTTRWRWIAFLFLVALFTAILGLLIRFSWLTRAGLWEIYEERIIKETPSIDLHNRNAVAVTETGPFELDYLSSAMSSDSEWCKNHWEELYKLGSSFSLYKDQDG